MQNRREEKDVLMVTQWEGRYVMESYLAQPHYSSCTILDENLVTVQMNPTKVTIDKPIYVGLSALDISKIVRFYYGFMKKLVPNDNLKLLHMDTDSFIIELKNHDIYQHMKESLNEFDRSDYPIEQNKKVPGKMCDEIGGEKVMTHFIGLRSKAYAYKV